MSLRHESRSEFDEIQRSLEACGGHRYILPDLFVLPRNRKVKYLPNPYDSLDQLARDSRT